MGQGQAAIDIARPADEVWAVAGDFGGIGGWMPGLDSCRVEGDDRILGMLGMEITEHLVRRADTARSLPYAITAGVPIEHHEATVTVTGEGGGSRVTWDVEALPDEMVDLMVGLYQQALEALKTHVEA